MCKNTIFEKILAQKKEIQAVEKNKSFKLENELMKLKSSKTSGKYQFKLENRKIHKKRAYCDQRQAEEDQ